MTSEPVASTIDWHTQGFELSKPELRIEAIRLRKEQRLSLEVISKQLGVSQGTCSLWLRAFPLTQQEIQERNLSAKKNGAVKDWGIASKHYRDSITDNNQKGRIAEAAIAFRLALHGFEFYKAEVAKFDFVVRVKERFVTLQVKWAKTTGSYGLPRASLRCSEGRGNSRTYRRGDFDYLVLYNLYDDTAYVFSVEDAMGKTTLTIKPEVAEQWTKLR